LAAVPEKAAPGTYALRLSNPTEGLAFLVRVRLAEESGTLRAYYSDNDLSLLPHETKTVTVRVEGAASLPSVVHAEISGWNCPAETVEIPASFTR
jgi:hypothetical protein